MRSFFEVLAGNDNAKKHIGCAVSEGTLPHALLLCGGTGSGKMLFAKEIAAAMNCENKYSESHALPCGKCNTCRRIRENKFLDVRVLEKSEDKASIQIEETREFLSDVSMSGAESDNRFYIFNDAHLITPQAQNSLLKVLEEPPEGVYIILLTERSDRMLSTIKSRVQSISMSKFSDEQLDELLIKISDGARILKRIDEEGYFSAIASADGNIGNALSLMNRKSIDEAKAHDEQTKEIIKAFSPKTPYTALREKIYTMPKKRQELTEIFEALLDGICDLISVKYDKNKNRRLFKDEASALLMSREIGIARLLQIYDLILGILDGFSKNANASAMLSKFTAELCLE